MKKSLLVCLLFLATIKVFGQRFAQYNTGSLYDSFENPSQRAFIPDTTKQFAFNFLIPNFDANLLLTGNGQEALKTRLFNNYYNTANLVTGQHAYNRFNVNANVYTIMLKVFTSEDGDQEMGVSLNTRAEARGTATDESIAFFNGTTNFPANSYANVFNDNLSYQAYHQLSFTYREQVTRRLAIGFKFSALAGLAYRKIDIDQSSVTFNKNADQAMLYLSGTNYASNQKGESTAEKAFPFLTNPGASVSIGTTYLDESGFKWQGNIKNLGFIRWSGKSYISTFSGSTLINNFSSAQREDIITHSLDSLTTGSNKNKSFVSPTNGLLELSINKTWWLNDDGYLKFSPTLIGSKELFYNGFTAALVAPLQFGTRSIALTTTYDELKAANLGFQYMSKSENSEFFIGSERLLSTVNFIHTATQGTLDNKSQLKTPATSFTGLDFYIGVSFKFGQLIERRMNSSRIGPAGDKGFFGKIWDGMFGKKDPNY
ncbi:DUF5723 family protein [Mucilaginibacter sp. dw_454]|uniref:DUF5723 family protein n=1 Tax=Mucilaginibacter sp. dw_454 TaxID=2720079 RepID=UPI001BD3B744|nr:DUF5723 family protein [Mucilaginibacter sp. dw_454]